MRTYLFAVSLLVTLCVSCTTSTQTASVQASDRSQQPTQTPGDTGKGNEAPSPGTPAGSSSLTDRLVGTWKHVSIAETPDGPREPLKHSSISWTFNADGTGTYAQTVRGVTMGSGKNEFKWTLDGDDLQIAPTGRGRAVTYTVVKHAEGEMTWRNNTLGDYYIVERQ